MHHWINPIYVLFLEFIQKHTTAFSPLAHGLDHQLCPPKKTPNGMLRDELFIWAEMHQTCFSVGRCLVAHFDNNSWKIKSEIGKKAPTCLVQVTLSSYCAIPLY